jgi:hypothetical protein
MSTSPQTRGSTQAFAAMPGSALWLALKRALLGIVLLCVFVSAGAWLMYAGIEPEFDAASAFEQASGATASGSRN